MRNDRLGHSLRALRLRLAWRQADAAAQSGLSRAYVARIERLDLDAVPLGVLRRYVETLGGRLDVSVRWRGAALDQLLDSDHAAAANATKLLLERLGWTVDGEVSFNEYGDRGRIDLLAYQPIHRTLVVVEVKTVIADIQDLLGSLDVKLRLARKIAGDRGWRAEVAAALLAVAATPASRQRIRRHGALFAGFSVRGQAARAWLKRPSSAPSGNLLLFLPASRAGMQAWRGGRQRVRRPAGRSADGTSSSATRRPRHAVGGSKRAPGRRNERPARPPPA